MPGLRFFLIVEAERTALYLLMDLVVFSISIWIDQVIHESIYVGLYGLSIWYTIWQDIIDETNI